MSLEPTLSPQEWERGPVNPAAICKDGRTAAERLELLPALQGTATSQAELDVAARAELRAQKLKKMVEQTKQRRKVE